MKNRNTTNSLIQIGQVIIHADENGRFSLNDLHRAAGNEERHSPNRWTRTEGYQSLIAELTPEMAFAPVESVRGGAAPGTYAVKDLVYAYAMWISPAFSLKVIRTFDALVTGVKDITAHQDNAVRDMLLVSDAVARVPGVNPGIAMSLALDAIQNHTGLPVTTLRKALPGGAPESAIKMNAGELGARFGLSARAINPILAELGLQIRNEKDWVMTDVGSKYGEMIPFTNRGHSGYQPLWHETVLDALRERLGPTGGHGGMIVKPGDRVLLGI